jgi:uncharacterized protein (DUF488 family)
MVKKRQEIILYFIEQAGRPLSRLEVTKWCFLLGEECPSKGGKGFYQFVPYHYGPFSFCLYREADSLVRDGRLDAQDDRTWILPINRIPSTSNLPKVICEDVSTILQRFGHKTVEQTISYVYRHYPWFTMNSRLDKRMERPRAVPAVYTAGYEGVQIDGFLNMLLRHGIRAIVDVRHNPVARRYGFHKSTLSRLSGNVGIEYLHVPQLGISTEYRRGLQTIEDYEKLFNRYEAETLIYGTPYLEKVACLIVSKPTVLVCIEADPYRCHRLRLAQEVSTRTGLPVVNLGIA